MAKKIGKNRNSVAMSLQTLENGLETYFQKKTLQLLGESWKVVDLVQLFQDHVSAMQAAAAAHTAWLQAVATQNSSNAQVAELVTALRSYIGSTYGTSSAEYIAMGFGNRAPTIASPATKVAAGNKGRATRAARHTMGKKQRASIHGVLDAAASDSPATGTSVTTAPAAAAATSTSSSNGSNGSSH